MNPRAEMPTSSISRRNHIVHCAVLHCACTKVVLLPPSYAVKRETACQDLAMVGDMSNGESRATSHFTNSAGEFT